MSFVSDMKDAKRRFAGYIEEFTVLLHDYGVSGRGWYENLRRANHDPAFVRRRDKIWQELLEAEGGKLTFGTVLAIVGAVLGGVGIAGAWGAFGLPLILLLTPAGIWIGNELDAEGITRDWIKWMRSCLGVRKQSDITAEPESDAENLRRWQEKALRSPGPID